METPSSTRMVTRSQTLSAIKNKSESEFKVLFSSSKKTEEPNKNKKERSVLIDITNDSPIVGLAMQTPPSGFMGKRQNSRIKNTPGSGEALLRCQVKTLLQKVEEGTEFIQQQQQIPIKSLPFSFINNLVTSSSPMRLIAPTPANTPQFHSFSDNDDDVAIKIASPVVAGHFRTTTTTTTTEQVSYYVEEEEEEEEEEQSVTRSLLFDFNDKTPLWEEEEEEEEEEEDVVVDELCEVMKKMSVEFKGKHSRFVYDGEDEEKIVEAKEVLHLKGIPTPRGKHLKFVNEEEKC